MTTTGIDALFTGMANADIHGKGSWMSGGVYEAEIKDISVKEGTNPKNPNTYKKALLIVEFTITKTNQPDKHPVGAIRTTILNSGSMYFFADVSKLMMALLDYDPRDKANQNSPEVRGAAELYASAQCGSEKARATLGDLYTEGMFQGKRLALECVDTAPTAEKPKGFTNLFWSPVTA